MPDIDTDIEGELDAVEVDATLADRLRDAQQAYDEVKAYLDDIKDEVKAQFAGHDAVRGVHNGETVFTCVRRSTTRFNSTKLKREYPSIWEQYAKTTSSVYMTVARPKAAS